MSLAERMAAFDRSPIPTWVAALDPLRFMWANVAALELWSAASLESFLARDLSDTSPSTRAQYLEWADSIRSGTVQHIESEWTIYPHGVPRRMLGYISLLEGEAGETMFLHHALPPKDEAKVETLRGAEALRHIRTAVALLGADGELLSLNPAAVRAFGRDRALHEWFDDPAVVPAILGVLESDEAHLALVDSTRDGKHRVYALEAHRTCDPATGQPTVLLHLRDETQRLGAERDARDKSRLIVELEVALATVEAQRGRILELSAPILPTSDRTLTVPLIGTLDGERMRSITERLLDAVTTRAIRDVVLDFTGVELADAASVEPVAALVRTLRLVGARTILTGIQPALASLLAETPHDWLDGERKGGGTLIFASLADGLDATRRRRTSD